MKIALGADVEVDIATSDDIRRIIREEKDIKTYTERIVAIFSGVTDASGKASFKVYDIPDGMTFFLYKFIVWGDAHNPSTGGVYTNAAAWGGIFHGQPSPVNLADFWPVPEAANGQVLPFTKEFGDPSAPEFRQNDNVYFQLVGGPVAENITVLAFGELRALATRRTRDIRSIETHSPLRKHPSRTAERLPAV